MPRRTSTGCPTASFVAESRAALRDRLTREHLVGVDCRLRGTPIVVEPLGHRFHRTKQQMARDAERLNALVLDGFTPFQLTYDQLVARRGRPR